MLESRLKQIRHPYLSSVIFNEVFKLTILNRSFFYGSEENVLHLNSFVRTTVRVYELSFGHGLVEMLESRLKQIVHL